MSHKAKSRGGIKGTKTERSLEKVLLTFKFKAEEINTKNSCRRKVGEKCSDSKFKTSLGLFT